MNSEVHDTYDSISPADAAADFITDEAAIESVRETIVSFVRDVVIEADARGAVVGMSGGVDSTLTTALAVEALGSDRVLGLGLPAHESGDHAREARTIADGLGIEFREIPIRPLVDRFEDLVAAEIEPTGGRRAVGNVVARLRMACLYYAANTRSRVVLGTANRSELLLGYFTKYGDGGADLYPLGDLYKTEVRALAHRFGVPRRIVAKEPTADLWVGQTDADDLGARYEEIDPILRHLVDDGSRPGDVVDELDADRETVGRVVRRFLDSRHKRAVPPTPGIDGRPRDDASAPIHHAPLDTGG